MGFDLRALMVPPVEREYVWWFDDAVDHDRSDFLQWFGDGKKGIVLKAGMEAKATVFRWLPLDPTTVECLIAEASAGLRTATPTPLDASALLNARKPAVSKLMVAHALIAIDNSNVAWSLVATQLGNRVEDAVIAALDRSGPLAVLVPLRDDAGKPRVGADGKPMSVPIEVQVLTHLGLLVVEASLPKVQEKKVSAPSPTRRRSVKR